MFQDVFILGASGNVGKTLIDQIKRLDSDGSMHTNPTRIVGAATRSSFIFDPFGLPDSECEEFCEHSFEGQKYRDLTEITAHIANHLGQDQKPIFVDVTNGQLDLTHFHLHVITQTTYDLVTANKNPLVLSSFSDFQTLTAQPKRYGYRCSVMAGAEAVDVLRDLRDLGDKVLSIEGCFSGTLGYICNELKTGKPFSAIVSDAHRHGYTEPNPADDLSGLDVEKKILILARSAGFDVAESDIHREPFIPQKYLAIQEPTDFIQSLKELDALFSARASETHQRYRALRYVASFDTTQSKPVITIGLRDMAAQSPLGALQGTSNKITIRTTTYNGAPYVIEAPGAGREITAQNIRRDLLYKIEERVVKRN